MLIDVYQELFLAKQLLAFLSFIMSNLVNLDSEILKWGGQKINFLIPQAKMSVRITAAQTTFFVLIILCLDT